MADGIDEFDKAVGALQKALAAETHVWSPPNRVTEHIPDGDTQAWWPEPIDLEALAETEPQPPIFIMPDWLPCGYATLFAGHGGVGKSGIALHLVCCIALGRPFFGMQCAPRRVLYLSCEDRQNVLHWRLARVAAHMGIGLGELRGKLDILDLVGRETVLWDARQPGVPTIPFAELQARVINTEREVIVVDGITDTFGGNLNAPAEVKRFVNKLVGIIPPDTGAVLLIGHVSKPTATMGGGSEGYSGTAAWHNAVRARWYLYPEKEGEDGERSGALKLELQKSNLGKSDQEMRFTWDDEAHLFAGESTEPASHLDRRIRETVEFDGVLEAFQRCQNANPAITVPTSMRGPRTVFNVLSETAGFPASLKDRTRASSRRLYRIIEQLRQQGKITESTYTKSDRHLGSCFVLCGNVGQ